MRDDLTDITLVVDRSGSMRQIQEDAEGGVNAFIEEQAKQEGEARLTIVQFDDRYDFVCSGVPIDEAPEYRLVPRGMTALLDAVGRAINETGERLAGLPEEERPGLVIFVVMTDGQENSSTEFNKTDVREMIEHQQSVYSWHFTFLGADATAFAEAGGMGIDQQGVARYQKRRVSLAYSGTSAKVARMRRQSRTGQQVSNAFTQEELDEMG